MATIAEQLTSLANTKTAIKDAIVAKGVTVADDTPFSGYAAKIGEIQGGGGAPATKFGVSIDNIIGDVDANGAYINPKETFEMDFSKLLSIASKADSRILPYVFYHNECAIGTVDLSNFTGSPTPSKNIYLFEYGFAHSGINKVILPKHLSESSGNIYMNNSFEWCELDLLEFGGAPIGIDYLQLSSSFRQATIKEIKGLDAIETIYESGLPSAFTYATLPAELNFVSLATLESKALQNTFNNAKGIEKVYFPALISAHTQAFGSSATNGTFYRSSVTEIHFRADAQAVIESLYGYASKFGATNASIMFDL